MRHMKKIVSTSVIIAVVLLSGVFISSLSTKNISGVVRDCESGLPVADAEVTARARGWGVRNGSIVWDKDFVVSALTDDGGAFSLKVSHAPDIWEARKENYLTALQNGIPSNPLELRILHGTDPLEYTYNCKKSSGCLQCETRDNVQTCRNICE